MQNSKSLILGALIILTVPLFWFFFYDAITLDTQASIYAVLCLSVYLVATGILFLFAERPRFVFLPHALGMASLFYFFGILPLTLLAYILILMAIFIGYNRVQKELENRMTFHVPILLRQGLPVLLTALSIACAIGYYIETAHAPKRITIRDIFPKSAFIAIFKNTVPLLPHTILSDFDQHDTIDSYTEKQLRRSGIDLQQLPHAERAYVLTESRKQLFPHTELTGTEKLTDVFYDIAITHSEKFLDSYQHIAPLALAFGIFLFLRTVALPYGWIILYITSCVIILMKKSGVLTRTEEHVVKERLRWT